MSFQSKHVFDSRQIKLSQLKTMNVSMGILLIHFKIIVLAIAI
jgi:hypothetical protein